MSKAERTTGLADSWLARGLLLLFLAGPAVSLRYELSSQPDSALLHYDRVARLAPQDPELLARRASCLLELRRHAEALEAAQRALAHDSLHMEALWSAAACLTAQGRIEEALDPVNRMVAQRPDRQSLTLQVSLLERLRRFEEALEPMNGLISLSPGSLHLRERRAEILLRLGRPDEALVDFWEMLELSPDYPGLVDRMAGLLRELSRPEDLGRLYQRLTEQLPDRRAYHWKLVEVLLQTERWDEAEAKLRSLRERFPDDGLPVLQLGLVTYRQGNPAEALSLIRQAAAMGIDSTLTDRWKMRVEFTEGMADSAARTSRRLLARNPESVEGWRIRALCMAELERYPEALGAIEQWARRDSVDAEPLVLGVVICRDGSLWEQGMSFGRRALARAPEDPGVLMEYAALLDEAGRLEEAERAARKVLTRNPESAVVLNFLGYMWITHDVRLDDAERMIEEALRLEPDNPAFLDSMGWLWYKKGDLKRAEDWLELAVAKGGRHPEIYEHLVRIKTERGKASEARQAAELGLTHNPQDPALQQLLRGLEGER